MFLTVFPFALTDAFAAVLAFKGLDRLRSRAERGRRVPVPLRKHKTMKEEQWSLLPLTRNTKHHQTGAELQAVVLGRLSCPPAQGELKGEAVDASSSSSALARGAAGGWVPRSIAKGLP